jgi:NAD(P)-dependent dehydrogenase (short-subunit alcohol dehydrogenase family)
MTDDSFASLVGKVAIVTGGAGGIGSATARRLCERGARVLLTDRNQEEGTAVAEKLTADGFQAAFHPHDVTLEDSWNEVIADAQKRWHRIDILVNNAAIVQGGMVDELTLDQFRRVLDVNVCGVFLGCKLVAAPMREAGGGVIINISSVAGLAAVGPGVSPYITSKGAVRLLTKSVAVDYGKYGIRAISVHPGKVDTKLSEQLLGDRAGKTIDVGRAIRGRPAEAREMASVITFLASDEASYMNGSEVLVEDGWLAR